MFVVVSLFCHGRLACADKFGEGGMGLSDNRVPALESNVIILK
jgi:hypothetical protein